MKSFISIFGLLLIPPAALASMTTTGTLSNLTTKIYGVWVSTSPTCENPIAVSANTSGNLIDFMSNPQIASSANIPPGTYECVIVATDLSWQATVGTSSSGPCTMGQVLPTPLCGTANCDYGCTPSNPNPDGPNGTVTDLNGNPYLCSSSKPVYFFFSTASTNATNGVMLNKPTSNPDNQHGMPLAAPLVVTGTKTSTFRSIGLKNIGYDSGDPSTCTITGSDNQGSVGFTFVTQ